MARPTVITDIITDPSTWRLQTATGIHYKKLSHTGSMTPTSLSCVETYVIQHEDFIGFLRYFFPLEELSPGSIPLNTYGQMQGVANIGASNISWESLIEGLPIDPFLADTDASFDTYARLIKVTVTFDDELAKPTSGNADPNDPFTFLEISANASGEFLHTPVPTAQWEKLYTSEEVVNNSATVPAQISVPETEWTLTWPRVNPTYFATVLLSQMRAALGKVNSVNFAPCYNATPETLLFVGWDMTQERQFLFASEKTTAGFINPPLTVTMKFLEKHVAYELPDPDAPADPDAFITQIAGHNHFWRPGIGWRRLLYNGTDYVYQSYDFNDIFSNYAAPDPTE
jgi:hypothetical protein